MYAVALVGSRRVFGNAPIAFRVVSSPGASENWSDMNGDELCVQSEGGKAAKNGNQHNRYPQESMHLRDPMNRSRGCLFRPLSDSSTRGSHEEGHVYTELSNLPDVMKLG